MIKKQILEQLAEALKKLHEEKQNAPNQYVVAYFKKDDDTLIGYHMSTACNTTNEMLEAKRYSGEDPYPQLETIAKNITWTLGEGQNCELFGEMNKHIKEKCYNNMSAEDIYLDAIYLAEDTPKQEFRYQIIQPERKTNIDITIDENLN